MWLPTAASALSAPIDASDAILYILHEKVFQINPKIKIQKWYVVVYWPWTADANQHEENSDARLMSVLLVQFTILTPTTLALCIKRLSLNVFSPSC